MKVFIYPDTRCRDPTECQTFSSGVFCQSCSSGYLLPNFKSPESLECSWICNSCKSAFPNKVVDEEILEPLIKSKLEVSESVSNEDDDDDSENESSDGEASENEMSSDEDEDDDDFSETLERIDLIEKWLWDAQKKLHPNHVWILEMEFQLVVAYSRLVEDLPYQLSLPKLRPIRERIVQMTMHLLEVRVLSPDINRNLVRNCAILLVEPFENKSHLLI